MNDEEYMREAIALGEKGRVTAPPNPWVGCVIVKNDKVIGKGFHRAVGEPHAEINALCDAREDVAGATLYCTLEPCSHYGRTPPCTKALIEAKIRKVVFAVKDPDTNVNGKGSQHLRDAGIEVVAGIGENEATQSLQPYLWHRLTGKPFCIVKAAVSIDGRVAAADNSSQWITDAEARQDSHRLRSESQAILVGSNTAIKDKPQLTARYGKQIRQPLRVILDSTGKVVPPSPLFDLSLAKTVIFTSNESSSHMRKIWNEYGVEVVEVKKQGSGLDLVAVLSYLGKKGVLQLLVEGGGTVIGNFFREHLINQMVIYTGPRILGDSGVPLFMDTTIPNINQAPQLQLIRSTTINNTVKSVYSMPKKATPHS